jgi:SAM-dependent methyltransferase
VFSASSYAAFRPTWPTTVFDQVLSYHKGPKSLCVDLGCGHGSFTRELSSYFTRVVGIDPSAPMVNQAASSTKEENVSFRQGNAEDLDSFGDGSIDMVISSQAAHWFDYSKVWPMLKRKLRTGGTLAFLGYKENVLVKHPKATEVLHRYSYDPGVDLMGPHWEQPGRDILKDKYRSIVPPEADFEDIRRLEYEPGTQGVGTGPLGERVMYKTMKLGEMEGYVRTFSAYYRWQAAHPDQNAKAKGGQGDIVDEMFEKMLEVPEWENVEAEWRDVEVESEWGSVILLARKKQDL